MTTKKVLLMVGLLAAIGIAYWAFNGTSPDDGEEGAVGAANRYRAEQMGDSDVQLEDAEVMALLQDDVFLELIQDEDFQALMAHEDFAVPFAQRGTVAYWRGLTPADLASHPDVVALAARDDLMAVGKSADVAEYLSKSWKMAGEGNTKEGRKGHSANVWGSREHVDALSKAVHKVMLEKRLTVADPVKKGNKWTAREVAEVLSMRANMAALSRDDVKGLMKLPAYQDLAKSWKMAGEGNTKEGRKGHSANVWGKYHVELLARPEVTAFEKSWKMAGEGNTKEGRKGHSANVWGVRSDLSTLAKRDGIATLMARPDVASYAAREKVSLKMQDLVAAGAFSSRENFAATFGKRALPADIGSPKGKKDK